MRASPSFLVILAVALSACATSYTPKANTRADLQAYVERAAEVVREQGAAACATFSEPRWLNGDYYIFVSTLGDNVTLCHPVRPDLVGKNQDNLQDANGKYPPREMQAAASSPQGRGWVEYVWPRPGQTTPVPKSAYVMAVTGPDGKRYIVGSGGYEMAP